MPSKTFSSRRSNYHHLNSRLDKSISEPTYTSVGSYADSMQAALSPSKPEQVVVKGNSYADIMASEGLKTRNVTAVDVPETADKASAPVSDICLKMSSMALSADSPKSKPSLSSIESIHSPKKTRRHEKRAIVIEADEKPVVAGKPAESVTSPQQSVLFGPKEVKVNKNYGGWTGLKGDPEKLERLNQPRLKALESRWAC